MSTEEEQHAGDQREEQNTLLRSLIGIVKVMGGAMGTMLLLGLGVLVADHFKLIAVSEAVVGLTGSTDKFTEDSRTRNEAVSNWRASVDVMLVAQKAETLALSNRVSILESELRQQRK